MAPITGIDIVLRYVTGTPANITNEPMDAVLNEFPGDVPYTIYEISDSSKRYLVPEATHVFEKYVDDEWETIPASDIAEIQYAGGRLILHEALDSDTEVRCASGEYYPTTKDIAGANGAKLTAKYETVDVTKFGDAARVRYPSLQDWSMSVDTIVLFDEAEGEFTELKNIRALHKKRFAALMFLDAVDDVRFEGYCYLESDDFDIKVGDVYRQAISLVGAGPLYLRR